MNPIVSSYAKHIVVVDDDNRIRQLLGKFLKEHGFTVSLAKDAEEAFAILHDLHADMLILDVMLPKKNGFEILKDLRKSSKVPIIMLTAIGDMENKIEGLSQGADDYLTKPFDPQELVLRIRNILRRTHDATPADAFDTIVFGEFQFSVSTQHLLKSNVRMVLGSSEASLLTVLAKQLGTVVTREQLAHVLKGVNERTMDVQITRLRQKIEKNPKHPQYLKTVRGSGYYLDAKPLS
jgi:two-component system phosphate regulon response regulator OmpR